MREINSDSFVFLISDYTKLRLLRDRFPKVPVMALTATATTRVRADIVKQLDLRDCKWFMSSFNRPNLQYMVLPKKGVSTIKEIQDLIKSKFMRASGIVYCLSRKECDQMAERLREVSIISVRCNETKGILKLKLFAFISGRHQSCQLPRRLVRPESRECPEGLDQ